MFDTVFDLASNSTIFATSRQCANDERNDNDDAQVFGGGLAALVAVEAVGDAFAQGVQGLLGGDVELERVRCSFFDPYVLCEEYGTGERPGGTGPGGSTPPVEGAQSRIGPARMAQWRVPSQVAMASARVVTPSLA